MQKYLPLIVVLLVLGAYAYAVPTGVPTVGNRGGGGITSDKVILCGNLLNSGTHYGGPATARYLGGNGSITIEGTTCDGLDNPTESTADEPIASDYPAFGVLGMWCRISTDPTNDVVFTMRSGVADLTPSVTCTIAGTGSATSCSVTSPTTVDVGAAAPIAMKAVTTEDLSTQAFWCQVYLINIAR